MSKRGTIGKAALVTGAAIRLGRSMALELAGRGFHIALHYLSSEQEARAAAEEIRSLGVSCALFQADLADTDQTEELWRRALAEFPDLELVVNSVSVFKPGNLRDLEAARLGRDLTINLVAPLLLARGLARDSGRGQVVNILDQRIDTLEPGYFSYTLTKAALRDATLMAARELGPEVRVNGIAPGPVLAPVDKTVHHLLTRSRNLPLARHGKTADINLALTYLLDADYVTGQILYVDGGGHLGERDGNNKDKQPSSSDHNRDK